jgi:tetratricopeptide (TPR) repeat protein
VTLNRLARVDEAEELYLEVLELDRDTLGDEHADTLVACLNLGSFYSYHRRYEEAEALLREAAETGRRALGPDHDAVPMVLRALGECLVYQGRYEESEPLLIEARRGTERTYAGGHPERREALLALEFLYAEWGKDGELASIRELLAARDG